jgi:aminoglycoside 6'-N-acetyltransferase
VITFQRVTPADFPLVARWLSNSHVSRWWNHEFSPEAVERDFGPTARGEEPAEDLLVYENGEAFALVQRSRWHDYPDELASLTPYLDVPADAMTIDYLIGERAQIARGRGTALVRAFVADTWAAHPATDTLIVPVSAGNAASWRVLEKNQFTRVVEAELEPDNPIDPPLHYVYRLCRTHRSNTTSPPQ